VGAFLWYLLRITLLIAIWKIYRDLKKPELKCWAFVILLVHVLTMNTSVVLNHTFAIYYWLLAGIAFGLPRLEQSMPQVVPATRTNVWVRQSTVAAAK